MAATAAILAGLTACNVTPLLVRGEGPSVAAPSYRYCKINMGSADDPVYVNDPACGGEAGDYGAGETVR